MARRLADHVERDAGRGIEVDPHLVGILRRRRPERPHVQPEYTHVHRPQHVGEVGDHEGPRRRAIDGLDRGRTEPLRGRVGDPLLEERLLANAVRVPLQQHRTVAYGQHQSVTDGNVVPDEVELRPWLLARADRWEHHLVGVGDRDDPRPSVDLDRFPELVGLGHHADVTSGVRPQM